MKHERCEDNFYTTNQFYRYHHVRSKQHTTPTEGELKVQMQAMMKMMERMNFVMGNMCDRLEKVEKHGNEVGTSTQDIRKVGVEPKSNNGNKAKKSRLADYEDFEEDVDDFGHGGLRIGP